MSKIMVTKKIMLGSGLLLLASAAGAQVAPHAPGVHRDAVQTRAEAVQRIRTMFARVDTNADGFLTVEEGRARRARTGQRMAQTADPARRAGLFDRLDVNRDNLISRDEWARAEALRRERRAEGERGGMRARMGQAMLRAADADRDQRISLAEAEAEALKRFDRVDANRDGRITPDERQQARQQWQSRRAAPQPVR
jgi:Ca2+-binding EF-hand superfamily protein